MPLIIDVATIQWAYFGLLIAFTICLALIMPLTKSSGLRWWLASNITTSLAFPLFIWRPEIRAELFSFLIPATLLVAAATLKLLAVTPAVQRTRKYIPAAILVSSFATAYYILGLFGWLQARLAFTLGTLSLLMGLIAYNAAKNRQWAGIRGHYLLVGAFLVASIMLTLRAARALHDDQALLYFSQGSEQSIAFAVNLIQLIVIHIGFIAVIVGRITRLTAIKQLRQAELIWRHRIADNYGRQMEAVAHEKHALLELLTHEVRQPLNNAQAALEEISASISQSKLTDSGMSEPVSRLHDTIDHVVLSLSNAILGASLIERRAAPATQAVDVFAIAELAKGDCPRDAQKRINLKAAERSLFLYADPTLLRLAFRNLLDNALKFSAAHSRIDAILRVDEARLGIVFEVFNDPAAPFTPHPALFERSRRGASDHIPGKGLGLFIVNEVARLHSGTVCASITEQKQTRFELFFPA